MSPHPMLLVFIGCSAALVCIGAVLGSMLTRDSHYLLGYKDGRDDALDEVEKVVDRNADKGSESAH